MAVDVAVIGAGIAGTAVAAFLADGGMRVRLYERSAIAAAASGRNSGIVQHPFDPLLVGLYRATLDAYAWLAEREPTFDLGDDPAGLLYVGHDREAAGRVAFEWQAAWPATTPQVLEGADLRRLEPALAPDLVACRLAVGYPIAPAAATDAFAAVARRAGVDIVISGAVTPAADGATVVGVVTDGRVEQAGAVIVATGPWAPETIDPGGGWRPIRSSWGVVVSVALDDAPRHGLEAIDIAIEPAEPAGPADDDAPPESGARSSVVEFSLVPAFRSSALGSTFLDREPDPTAWLQALRATGSRFVPAIATAPVEGMRHCARPVSRDGRPLVGRASWLDGLWIVAGHGPWGISTGPGSAGLVADAILGRTRADAIPPELRPDRFGTPL
ncbi:MAG: FAD-binding oxidoreductase [Chloroflexi bacterium]|nr:FAD-binding oxidoreductase [Chloroflexota bacterium]